MKPLPHVFTGSKKLDTLLGKACPGFPRGKLTLLTCPTDGDGLTTLLLSTAGEVAYTGGEIRYFAPTFDVAEAVPLGIDEGQKGFMHLVLKGEDGSAVVRAVSRGIKLGVDLIMIKVVAEIPYWNALTEALKGVEGSNTALLLGCRMDSEVPMAVRYLASRNLRISEREAPKEGEKVLKVESVKDSLASSQGKMVEVVYTKDGFVSPSTKKVKTTNVRSRFDREDLF